VIGTAAVGALLQNRLVSALTSQAAARSAALPPQMQAKFLAEIGNSAKSGIQVGAGQSAASAIKLPAGLPAQAVQSTGRIAHEVFTFAFVDAAANGQGWTGGPGGSRRSCGRL